MAVEEYIAIFWILLVLILIALCLNWAVIVDIITYVVPAQYRSTAVGVQTLMSHLLGKMYIENMTIRTILSPEFVLSPLRALFPRNAAL